MTTASRSCGQRNSGERAAIRAGRADGTALHFPFNNRDVEFNRRSRPSAKRYPGIIRDYPLSAAYYLLPLGAGRMLRLWYVTIDAHVSAFAGILTLRTSTTGAERNARFVRTADVGGEASGR